MKTCLKCLEAQPLEAFHKDRNRQDGRNPVCKRCVKKYNAKHYRKNGDRRRAQAREYNKKNRAQLSDYDRRRKYGLTRERYEQMVAQQKGLCAICKQPESLVVDHDHATGKIRGLLCGPCNRGLGFFADSSRRLIKAALYLG